MKVIRAFASAVFVSLVFSAVLAAQQPVADEMAAANSTQAVSASVPRLIRYTGTLTDASGKPLTGTVEVQFSIYQDQNDASPLWQETQSLPLDAQGRYTVLLGATQPDGLPAELFSSGMGHWLGVEAAGAAPQPHVLLVAVPYALKAADADTLGGKPASAFMVAQPAGEASSSQNPGTVAAASSPTAQVTGKKDVTLPIPVTGSGTPGFLPLWIVDNRLGNSVLFQSGGNLGVGTTTPGATLDIFGAGNGIRGTSSGATGVAGFASAATGVVSGVTGNANSTTNGAAGVNGFESASTGQVFGVEGATPSTTNGAAGVNGNATGTTGIVSGVSGSTNSATNGAAGVSGFATATNAAVSGVSGGTSSTAQGAAGVNGWENAATGQVYGVNGGTSSTGPYAAGVTGYEGATTGAVFGVNGGTNSTTNGAAGVNGGEGAATGVVYGVSGESSSATANAAGVNGWEGAATGAVFGVNGSTNSTGPGAAAVNGYEGATAGAVFGVNGSTNSTGPGAVAVNGYEGATTGAVFGVNGSTNSTGPGAAAVQGFEGATTGQVYGVAGGTNSTTNGAAAVSGYEGAATGQVFGVAGGTNSTTNGAAAVNGYEGAASGKVYGVSGTTASGSGGAAGVFGHASATSGNGTGVWGNSESSSGNGVMGYAPSSTGFTFGVQGMSLSSSGVGVQGSSPNNAVAGFSQACGSSGCTIASGVAGRFVTGTGGTILQGLSGNSLSSVSQVFSVDSAGDGTFAGNLNVTGTLTKGGGSFKIDHPLDPANKYLSHSFVESPDMMNIYNGNVVTDDKGEAEVVLPDYFEALNRDFRYQLTVIGQFAQAIVGTKIKNHRFTIRTDKPGVEVSWQVTGIRQDAYANANRIPVEEVKPPAEQGYYLHPELYGQPDSRRVGSNQSASHAQQATRESQSNNEEDYARRTDF